ncbi:MAG: nucleotide-diphospho-sugar transferase [Bacteroidales bacterium]|nr:nucleotide-diphospho-sugar transferase [Bacteroidales bacterium]
MASNIPSNRFSVPILFVVFNRLDTAERVFGKIKELQPQKLYIAADGPRANKEGEAEKCQQVRDLVKQVDWDCELKTLFREQNLGCAKAVSGAVSWLFENEEMGIILEDDCMPHADFFPYCQELLEKYKDDNRVSLIAGGNFQNGIKRGEASYYFSAYPLIWGWAAWRRTWKDYDLYLNNYSLSEFKQKTKSYFSWYERKVWQDRFVSMKKRETNTWDYQLCFHIWKQQGLCLTPNVNLVTNIGLESGTHFENIAADNKYFVASASILPLVHPQQIQQNKEADKFHYKHFIHKNIVRLIYRKTKRLFCSKPTF